MGTCVKSSGLTLREKVAEVIVEADQGPAWLSCACGEQIRVQSGEAICLQCHTVYHPETMRPTRFSGRFRASELGPEWECYTTLAELCEAANLTRRQAQIVLLFSRGWSWAQIAPVLRVTRANARRYFKIAVTRIARSRPHIVRERREWANQILYCLREVSTNPPTPTYDEWKRPVSLRARMVTAYDLGGEEGDLLAELVEDLKREPKVGSPAKALPTEP